MFVSFIVVAVTGERISGGRAGNVQSTGSLAGGAGRGGGDLLTAVFIEMSFYTGQNLS